MSYDEGLAHRIRLLFSKKRNITEMNMFSGLAFLLKGNMCVGVIDKKLMVRVGAGVYEEMLEEEDVTPMNFTGRPLRGFIYVLPSGTRTDKSLQFWLEQGIKFVKTLPPKQEKS